MKKLLLLLALVGMVAYGCTDSSTDDDNKQEADCRLVQGAMAQA